MTCSEFLRARWTGVALAGTLALGAASCDSLLVDPAPAPATVTASFAFGPVASGLSAGPGEAYDKVDEVRVRLTTLDGGDVVHDEAVPFESTGGDTPLPPITVLAAEREASYRLQIEMLWNGQAMFSGSETVELERGTETEVTVVVDAIPSSIVVDAVPPFDALGDTRQAVATVVFASGDDIPSAEVMWTSADPSVVSVTPDGLLTATGEGEADVTVTHDGLSESVTVVVAAVVESVAIEPAEADAVLGATVQFDARALDRNDNPLVRVIAWSVADPEVAVIDADGLATAVGLGTTEVVAEAEGVEGRATLVVSADPPLVTTRPASSVITTQASLRASVVPNGLPSVAWFEWGRENDPGSFVETPERDVGGGFTEVAVEEDLSGLEPGTTYYFRAAARNEIGTRRGEILAFETEPLLVILTTTLPAGIPDFSYSAQLEATGGDGSYIWGLAAGALPQGLALTSDGRITGTPTTPGTAQFTVQVASGTQTATAALSLTVVEELQIVTEKLPQGAVGASYNAQLEAQGGTGMYAWSLVSGSLPPGLTLTSGGLITGTPTETGAYQFRAGVTSGPQTAARDMSIFVVQPTGRIAGSVTFAGSPLAGIQVFLSGPVSRATVTDQAGGYAFSALPEGTHTVTIDPGIPESQFGPVQKSVFLPDGGAAVVNFGGDGPPDLTVPSGIGVASSDPHFIGGTVTLTGWTVRNAGNGPSGSFGNGFYLSTNSIISTFDTFLGSNGNSSLAPGESFTWGGPTLTIPTTVAAGDYYIGVLVDRTGAVAESNESNNYAAAPIRIQAPIGVGGRGSTEPEGDGRP